MFNRGLEGEIQLAAEFLQNCRPLAVSMTNALKYIKEKVINEKSFSDSDDVVSIRTFLKHGLCSHVFTFLEKAALD